MNQDEMMVMQISQHIAVAISPRLKKHGGCCVILALDYATQDWGKPTGTVLWTFTSVN